MEENNTSSISQADSYEAIGAFWDEHDFTDFDDLSREDVVFEIQDSVRVEADLLSKITSVAHQKGVTVETLVNLWLQEKVLQAYKAA